MTSAGAASLSFVESGDEALLREEVARWTAALCAQAVVPADPRFEHYLTRLRACVTYHAARMAPEKPVPLRALLGRLERGQFPGVTLKGNVPREVVLAQALEHREAKAAAVFEAEFMPIVRGIARSVGGERAVAAVDNFGADLVLPRDGRGPKIAIYSGRTTLTQWLAPVVTNALRSEVRRRQPGGLTAISDPPARSADPGRAIDTRACAELLRPIFTNSCRALEPADRLLLQMLVLDEVPQKDVARCLGLHSGTITRRRQHAATTLMELARRFAAASADARRANDCLETVLADDDPELRWNLAETLAHGVRSADAVAGGAP